MQGGFPIDLILFAMVAAFLVLRLRSVLGRRTGFERPPEARPAPGGLRPRTVDGEATEVPPAQPRTPDHIQLPDSRSPAGQAVARIRAIDPAFDPRHFLSGAEAAFGMIVDAFAKGDRDTLRSLLGPETFAGFEGAIAAREAAGETQRTELRSMQAVSMEEADLRGTVADITVRFVSDQVNVTLGPDNKPTAGADAVAELTDLWTFQRDLRGSDPTWKLVDTRSA